MATVYIEARPTGRPEGTRIDDYVVKDHADHVLATFPTQKEAIDWAKSRGHTALAARVRHLNDKRRPEHWRMVHTMTELNSQEFEDVVADLFRAEKFEVERPPPPSRVDIVVKSPAGNKAVVEVKLYRTQTISAALLLQIASQLELSRRALQADTSIIVIGGDVTSEAKNALKKFGNTLLYGAGELTYLALKTPPLLERLQNILRESKPFSPNRDATPVNVELAADVSSLKLTSHAPLVDVRSIKGSDLCKEIKSIKYGRRNAKNFEEKALEALKYIFEGDLTAWSPQKATDTGISIYDVVARITSSHDFWKTITNQFQSRYVIFEFKNYEDKIKQGQVYTTEKYLF